jgi:hypothetical protein
MERHFDDIPYLPKMEWASHAGPALNADFERLETHKARFRCAGSVARSSLTARSFGTASEEQAAVPPPVFWVGHRLTGTEKEMRSSASRLTRGHPPVRNLIR